MISKDARDVDGNTSLHLSSSQGQLDVIKFLISEATADFTIKNNAGYLANEIAFNTEVQTLFA